MWVEFLVGSCSCAARSFSRGTPVFPSLQRPTHPTKQPGTHGHILNEFQRALTCSVDKQIRLFYMSTCYCFYPSEYLTLGPNGPTTFTSMLTDNNLDLSGDLADLSTEISIKEKLIDELETSQKKLQSLKTQYEEKLSLLHNKIKETETERDQVSELTLLRVGCSWG